MYLDEFAMDLQEASQYDGTSDISSSSSAAQSGSSSQGSVSSDASLQNLATYYSENPMELLSFFSLVSSAIRQQRSLRMTGTTSQLNATQKDLIHSDTHSTSRFSPSAILVLFNSCINSNQETTF